MNVLNKFRNRGLIAIMLAASVLTACSDDDDDDVTPSTTTPPAPPAENEEEVITNVKLIFTNNNDAMDVVTAEAIDADGPGLSDTLEIKGSIDLDTSKTYTLTFEIWNAEDPNNLNDPTKDKEDIAEEIAEEDDEHMIFFGFTNDVFASPAGNGNIDNRADFVDYKDEDSDMQDGSGFPVGLTTEWRTSGTISSGNTFTVVLKHQPDEKDANSTSMTGEDDFRLTFDLNVQ